MKLERVQLLELRADDFLIVYVPDTLPVHIADRITENFSGIFGHRRDRTIVIDAGVNLAVIRRTEEVDAK